MATRSSQEFYHDFIQRVAGEAGIRGIWSPVPELEVWERRSGEARYLFFLNHGTGDAEFVMEQEGDSLLEKKAPLLRGTGGIGTQGCDDLPDPG